MVQVFPGAIQPPQLEIIVGGCQRDDLRSQVLDRTSWRGISVGFDGGDAIVLGRLVPTGSSAPAVAVELEQC